MREIKSSYPRNRVLIHFEGDDSFLNHPSIEHIRRYDGNVEIKLRPSANLDGDAQSLLALAIARARVSRFEIMGPTLEEIFIEKVQETLPAKNGSELSMAQLEQLDGGGLHA
jgi:ABC-2 type transport system ATP-binding protein